MLHTCTCKKRWWSTLFAIRPVCHGTFWTAIVIPIHRYIMGYSHWNSCIFYCNQLVKFLKYSHPFDYSYIFLFINLAHFFTGYLQLHIPVLYCIPLLLLSGNNTQSVYRAPHVPKSASVQFRERERERRRVKL